MILNFKSNDQLLDYFVEVYDENTPEIDIAVC